MKTLLAVVEALMDSHADERRAAGFEGRPMRVTILQGLEMLLAWEANKNHGLYEHQTRDDQPDNTIYMSGLMFGGLASTQEVVCDILEECMRVLGAKPFRRRRESSENALGSVLSASIHAAVADSLQGLARRREG